MSKSRTDYTAANRIAWNEAAPRHAVHNNTGYFEAFKNPGYISFEGEILDTLRAVDVRDKRIIQLCWNNGSDLESDKKRMDKKGGLPQAPHPMLNRMV